MGKDIIYREDAIEALKGRENILHDAYTAVAIIRSIPSADRPQEEWKGYEIPSECSVCGHHWDEYVFGQDIWHDGSVPNYCPHCGARMKGADDE